MAYGVWRMAYASVGFLDGVFGFFDGVFGFFDGVPRVIVIGY